MGKKRLDILLVEKGLFASREKAKGEILAGNILVNGQREDKVGSLFHEDVLIDVKKNTSLYVSRGGLKLEKAIEAFSLTLLGKDCLDVGASTGGFTHCMLLNGSKRVISLDVGYGQLAWELRKDERVFCMEKTNIRYLKKEQLPFIPEFVSIDVSFISLKKVLPAILAFAPQHVEIVCLIKPQFEAGREKVGKKGVVRELKTHLEVCINLLEYTKQLLLYPCGFTYSPIKGPEGNLEFLLYLKRMPHTILTNEEVETIVLCAHQDIN